MQGTSIWWIMAAVVVLLIAAALWDFVVQPWLRARHAKKFYRKMKREQKYEN